MATNRDLLTEAIADAKSVRDTAITNAKLALEESFTPHLKSMLSAKLAEMEDEDVKEVKDEIEETVEEVSEKVEDKVDEEIDLDELLAELEDSKKGNKEEQKKMEGAIRDDRDHIKDLEGDIKDNERKLAKLKADEKKDVNESESSDLDEAKDEDDKMEEAKKADDKEDVKEDARTDAEEEGYLDGEKDEKEDMEDGIEDEEIDLEDMSEDDLKGFIEDVIKDMVIDGEIEPGDEFVEDEVEVEDEIDIEDVEDVVDVDVEIDEAKKEELDEKKEEIDERKSRVKGEKGPGNEDGDRDDTKVEKETEKMRFKEEQLASALAEVNKLKDELNEVNLLNAKLLYTNKIFKAKNLTESKKVKVLKAFDNAKDVAQAKTIFETLNTGLIDKSVINENQIKGSASKATGIEPKAEKQPIIESNDVYNRMRKLAGLI